MKKGTYEQLYYENYGGHIEISGCDKSAAEAVIPAEIDGVPVTRICSKAFAGCSSLADITIPDSVTEIGSCAFSATPWLESKQKENPLVIVNGILIDGTACSGDVIIPDSVTSIGNCAFEDCSSLTSITIPDSVTRIGQCAFNKCSSLADITIPDSVTEIESCAFSATPWLESKQKENPLVIVNGILIDGTACSGDVIIPDSAASIGDRAFEDCSSLTSITIPDSVTYIGWCAFNKCSSLTDITIPDSVISIDGYVFSDTPWLESKQKENPLVIVNGILIDGTACSYYVIIPDSVKSIGNCAFEYCSSLTKVKIPDSIASIGKRAFSLCLNLKDITIPESAASIGENAFFGCSNLKSIAILNPGCEICDSEDTIYAETEIKGYENSAAQAYAEKYNRKFVSLSKAPKTTGGNALLRLLSGLLSDD